MSGALQNKNKTSPGRKLEPILRAARGLFLEHGFSGTSMDAVAAQSGVSKATLYAYFDSKQDLFSAVVSDFSARHAAAAMAAETEGADLRLNLHRLARSVLALMLADDAIAAHRMVIAEAPRCPELGRLYYESGPERLNYRVANVLQTCMKKGQLRQADPKLAAEQFIALVKGSLRLRAMVCADDISEKEKKIVLSSGVDAFCRAYCS